MSIFTRIGAWFERRARQADTADPFIGMLSSASSAGVTVNAESALSISGVFAAIRNISEDIAGLPLITYRRLPGGGKERATNHPLYSLLHDVANPEMTAMECRQAVLVGALLWGNGYGEIVRDGRGIPVEVWPIESPRVSPMRDRNGKLYYLVDNKDHIPLENMLHIKGLTINGVVGQMTLKLAKESFAIGIAAQRFAANFFANGLRMSGYFSHPGKLTPEGKKHLKKELKKYMGVINAHDVPFFQEGMKFEKDSSDPEQAQLLESRLFSVEDVARWFRIPPHMVGHLLRATFSNIEHQQIEYSQYCLRGWCKKCEAQIHMKMVPAGELGSVVVEHLLDDLLRGDSKTRNESYQIQLRNGAITLDEWRAAENRNPVPDGAGSKHLISLDLTTVDRIIADPPEPKALPEPKDTPALPAPDPALAPVRDDDKAYKYVLRSHTPLLVDAMARVLRVEIDKASRAAKKPDFPVWRDKFYGDHSAYVRSALMAPAVALASAIAAVGRAELSEESRAKVVGLVDGFVARHVAASVEDLMDLDGVEQRVESWDVRAAGVELFAGEILEFMRS